MIQLGRGLITLIVLVISCALCIDSAKIEKPNHGWPRKVLENGFNSDESKFDSDPNASVASNTTREGKCISLGHHSNYDQK